MVNSKITSQMVWTGRRSTNYFLLLKRGTQLRVRKDVKKLQRKDGTFATYDQEIIDMQASFYEDYVWWPENKFRITKHYQNYMEMKEECEGLLTVED